jgi:hypothetical protein
MIGSAAEGPPSQVFMRRRPGFSRARALATPIGFER